MTSVPMIIDEAEAFLRHQAAELTQPREAECLCCYVARLLDEFPCDGSLRYARYYRDQVAPRATALDERLARLGGYCDCEIFMNGYRPRADDCDDSDDCDEAGYFDEADDAGNGVKALGPPALPPCNGVRRGSTQPCDHWVRQRRW